MSGLEHVPARGRAMLVGNHSGGVALDGAMVLASLLLEMEPPRLGQGMAEKFLNQRAVRVAVDQPRSASSPACPSTPAPARATSAC